MNHERIAVGQELSISEMVGHVFDSTDLKPATRKTYLRAAKTFTDWAYGRPLDVTVLVAYKNHLRDRNELSAKTKNLYLASTRTVFRQLFALGVLPFDASKTVKSFTVSSGHKRPPITDQQAKHAFDYAARRGDLRLTLIFNLLFRQGLRQKEVVDITVEHFDESSATLAILGKGRDDREMIHLHPQTVHSLKAFLRERGTKAGFVFSSRKRCGSHITTNALYKIVQEVHRACGISNTPHSWRKVFASKLIESGMNLLDVQAYTRHKSVGQLKVYFDRISFQKSLPSYYAVFAASDSA